MQYAQLGLGLALFGTLAVGCTTPPVAAGGRQTCATDDGRVRCWGTGQYGVLGYGNTNNIGDNEAPRTAGDVPVGANVEELATGYYHTCATTDTGEVRCWGRNDYGQLGYGHTNAIGDNEPASAGGPVSLGGPTTQVTAGIYHTCALLATGAVRCFGNNWYGQLGYGHTNPIGDNELASSVAAVNLGAPAVEIKAGDFHTCARLSSGAVRCWGLNGSGQLGYGHTTNIGDNESPASAGNVNLGGSAQQLAAGGGHTCALLDTGVKCWGSNSAGQLGYGNTTNVSNPAGVGIVSVGGSPIILSAGGNQTCVLDSDFAVRCWGEGLWGKLGSGTTNIGDNELPSTRPALSLGGDAMSVSVGHDHSCAVISDGGNQVRCWGNGFTGALGYGNTQHVGDNELPSSLPYVDVE